MFHVDRSTVLKYVRHRDALYRAVRMNPEQEVQAVRLYATGRTTESIAHELGVSGSTICKNLVKVGVTIRGRGPTRRT